MLTKCVKIYAKNYATVKMNNPLTKCALTFCLSIVRAKISPKLSFPIAPENTATDSDKDIH